MNSATPQSSLEGVTIEASQADIQRRTTGLWTLDRAYGGGIPLRSYTEISGWEGSGKSSLSYFLLGSLRSESILGVGDNEGMDPNYAARCAYNAGWRGTLRVVPVIDDKGEPQTEEVQLDTLADYLLENEVSGILLDSIGGLSPVGEEEGSVADANMGKRALIVGRFLRRAVHRMRRAETAKVLFCTNHMHPMMGGPSGGTITSGGKAVHYLAATRFRISRIEEDGFWLINGKVIKRRYNGLAPINTFQVVLVPGEGVHKGLTAVQDCLLLGIAEKTTVVKLGDKSFGYFKTMVENRSDLELFAPFYKALEGFNASNGLEPYIGT